MSADRMDRMTRRAFLRKTSVGAAAWGGSAMLARAAVGANERISIGIVGTGDRGRGTLMSQIAALAKTHNAEVTALCDVWKVNLAKAAAQAAKDFGREPRTFTRFADLLALEDVDAVMIATADHAHTPIMIAALKAGKDVYCEKPMSLDIGQANEALDLARRHERVVQVGTQNRSNGIYAAGREVYATGVLGDVSRVTASVNFNHARWARPFDDCKESDVDWDAYLMGQARRPFDPKLLRRWHLYRPFSNGLIGLWGVHYIDAMHLVTGAAYPRSAAALGGTYVWKDGREHTDVVHALWDYPEGFHYDWAMSLTNSAGNHWRLHGTKGTMEAESGELGVGQWLLSAAGGSDRKLEPRKVGPVKDPGSTGDLVRDHVSNWLDCLRTRQRPRADIEYGHQHSVASVLAATALETGRRQVYDADKREMRPG